MNAYSSFNYKFLCNPPRACEFSNALFLFKKENSLGCFFAWQMTFICAYVDRSIRWMTFVCHRYEQPEIERKEKKEARDDICRWEIVVNCESSWIVAVKCVVAIVTLSDLLFLIWYPPFSPSLSLCVFIGFPRTIRIVAFIRSPTPFRPLWQSPSLHPLEALANETD